jgi:hypothetical protein
MNKQVKQSEELSIPHHRILLVWQSYFLAASVMGGFAIFFINHAQTGAISSADKIMLASIGLTTLFCLFLFVLPWILPYKYTHTTKYLAKKLKKPKTWCSTLIITGVIFIGGAYLVAQIPAIQEPFSKGILLHLQPVLGWLSALGLLTLLTLPIARYGSSIWHHFPKEKIFYFSLIYIILILIGWGLISGPFIKTESRFTGWNSLGVPVFETQVLTAWLAIVVILLITTYYQKNKQTIL